MALRFWAGASALTIEPDACVGFSLAEVELAAEHFHFDLAHCGPQEQEPHPATGSCSPASFHKGWFNSSSGSFNGCPARDVKTAVGLVIIS